MNGKAVALLLLEGDHPLLMLLGQSQIVLKDRVCPWQGRVSIVRKPIGINRGRS